MTPRFLVWTAAVIGFSLFAKVVDLATRPKARARRCPTPLHSAAFLLAWPGMDVDAFLAPLDVPRGPFVARKVAGGLAKLAVFLALLALGAVYGPRSRALSHVLNVLEVYAGGSGSSDLIVGAGAVLGWRVLDVFRWPIAATSVLDFWNRYNRHVNGWLRRHVFDRVGRRRPALAVLATFAASALIHEVIFVVAIPSLVGRQTLFFMGHGLVGLGGAWAGRAFHARTGRAVPALVGNVLTVLFVMVSSVVFLDCMNAIVDIHGVWGAGVLGVIERARRAT